MAQRTYPTLNGTCDMPEMYGINRERNAQLKNLINPRTGVKYTYASAKDNFPAFAGYCEYYGWSQSEFLSLYEYEAGANDFVWGIDTYFSNGPNYARKIPQFRGHIKAPDGYFQTVFGMGLALGRYSGKHSNMSHGGNPNNTSQGSPGTALAVDHVNWLSARQPYRCSSFCYAGSTDYGASGGIAYNEGLVVEDFRFMGGRSGQSMDPNFKSWGMFLGDMGECSQVVRCMSEGFNNGGYAMVGGTPAKFINCSVFYNAGPGFDLFGNSGLSTITLDMPSGDNNYGGLISLTAATGGVAGGTLVILNPKSESRGMNQRLLTAKGDFNVTIIGGWCNYEFTSDAEVIVLDGRKANPGQGANFQCEIIGLKHSGNVKNLLTEAATGITIQTAPWKPSSVGINDEGVYGKSRTSIVVTGGGTTPPTGPTDPTEPPPSNYTELSRTGWTAVASSTDGTNTAGKAIDGSASTFWMSNSSMTSGGPQITVDTKSVKTFRRLTFKPTDGWSNSWPRDFEVFTSNTGSESSFSSRGRFSGAFNSEALWAAGISARFVRIRCVTANANWMNIGDLKLWS